MSPADSPSLQTPSQTVGPFFHYGLIYPGENVLAGPEAQGTPIVITGQVFDGDGNVLPDVMLEIWQADAHGRYAHPGDSRHAEADPHLQGWGRSDTTHPGETFRFETIKPGPVSSPDQPTLAPHVVGHLFGRGLLTHLALRMYFADETAANEADPVFSRLAPRRRETLLAHPAKETIDGRLAYHWDIHLQGPAETLFFHP